MDVNPSEAEYLYISITVPLVLSDSPNDYEESIVLHLHHIRFDRGKKCFELIQRDKNIEYYTR
jgi:hypothetical protein